MSNAVTTVHRVLIVSTFFVGLVLHPYRSCATAEPEVVSLDGSWQFRPSGTPPRQAKTITVPNPFEVHEGSKFDGTGIYLRTLPVFRLGNRRVILRFRGSATLTDVYVNGRHVTQHLGGWTPFQVDITPYLQEENTLEVHVDERVGHDSQGFLPVFAPHFGGLWQGVELRLVAPCWVDDLTSEAWADAVGKRWRIKLRFHGRLPTDAWIGVTTRRLGKGIWGTERRFAVVEGLQPADKPRIAIVRGDQILLNWQPPSIQRWSPETPVVYELRLRLGSANLEQVIQWDDSITLRSGFRTVTTEGRTLRLNDRPLTIRGVLNWGWAPPRIAPSVDEAWFREELRQARAHGFNLMKFCLWVPPRRYLEIADEMGMLTWVEYPTWHSRWQHNQLAQLKREFSEFFANDRHHPSIVLRSLTCETGPEANLDVIEAIYDLCHQMVPGSIVEDDSSWIQWNRVHDFYDDHPYGNNQTWPQAIAKLEKYISDREAKPLVLGEAMAADTWYDRQGILDYQANRSNHHLRGEGDVSNRFPFWFPIHFAANRSWYLEQSSRVGAPSEEMLRADSLKYAMLMRKYQIETFRRLSPSSGYVVSVIRDFPFAEMGLLDHAGKAKWPLEEWRWHQDVVCLMETPQERRAFTAKQPLVLNFHLHHGGPSADLPAAEFTVEIVDDRDKVVLTRRASIKRMAAGTCAKVLDLAWTPPAVEKATCYSVRMYLESDGQRVSQNQWKIWAVPTSLPLTGVYRHSGCRMELLPSSLRNLPVWRPKVSHAKLVIASRWDGDLIDYLESGGRSLVLADGRSKSLKTSEHWFLKGGPLLMDHPLVSGIGREFLLELQHFDLAGPVMRNLSCLDEVDPIALLWDNHDIDHVQSHGLAFEALLGKGRLLATSWRLNNAAGQFVAAQMIEHLLNGQPPKSVFEPSTVQAMRQKLGEQRIDLTKLTWKFRQDPRNIGMQQEWNRRQGTETWQPIKIGRAWEAEGYAGLDGWAWYQIEMVIPLAWKQRQVYFSLEGADDYYEVYVNGVEIGRGGDRERRITAFDSKASHLMSDAVQFGVTNRIVVRVEDWQGAGGLFRPVWIGTAKISSSSLLR